MRTANSLPTPLPIVPNLGSPTAPLPVLTVGDNLGIVHVEDAMKKLLDEQIAKVPEGKRGDIRFVVGMQGITVTVVNKVGDHVVIAANVGKEFGGDVVAGASVGISWAPAP